MARLGPFEPSPVLAVAVSGGADSTALAILARRWLEQQGGSLLALVVDHGLRPTSAAEAAITVQRLTQRDIPARLLPLSGLTPGPALAERARIMRYRTLTQACQEAGILHLLLGHHVADQMETLVMRVLRGSQTHGLAGMSALRETPGVRLLRPLLGLDPAQLRRFLVAIGADWIEDPSNQDPRAMRSRLRHRLSLHPADDAARAMADVGRLRAKQEIDTAAELASRVTIRPEGFAVLSPGRIGSAAMSRLIRTIGGLSYPPGPNQISDLAAQPRPATIAGVRIMRARRSSADLLIVREEAAVMEPRELSPDMIWDGRFRVIAHGTPPVAATIGKLGADAVRFRGSASDLRSCVLRTLPAVRVGNFLAAVPHLGYGHDRRIQVLFSPPEPMAGACFLPADLASGW